MAPAVAALTVSVMLAALLLTASTLSSAQPTIKTLAANGNNNFENFIRSSLGLLSLSTPKLPQAIAVSKANRTKGDLRHRWFKLSIEYDYLGADAMRLNFIGFCLSRNKAVALEPSVSLIT